MGVRKLEF
jgi:hypothetical protein